MSSSAHSSISSGSRGGLLKGLPPPHNGPNLVPLNMVLTPKNLLKKHKLPTAAHLLTPTAPPGLDLSRPLLLYNTYNSIKVRGVSLKPGRDGNLTPVGPAIVIPESYSGWFSIVGSDGHTAPFFSTVEQVANNQVSFFLTRYDVPSYTNVEDADGRVSYQKTVVPSGHVLKFMGVYEDLNVRPSSRRPQDASSVFNCDKYAQCLNYRNEVMFLPFSASGRFYTTAQKSSKNHNHVYLIAHILKNHKLPITVRLVCGYMPRVPCSFTGLLRLEKQQKEAVILACTMTPEADATLFEIDVNSNFVLKPVKDPMFPKTPIFLKTVSYCEDEADAWRRQIKVTHHVTEKRSRSLTRSLSDKFVEPLANVRPLSLSFLGDFDKRKNRERDSSRDSKPPQISRDKSKDKSRDHRFREFRSREKSVEKTKFKYHSGSFSGFPLKDQLLAKKNPDARKVSKQNTYVLQNGRSSKNQHKKSESEGSIISNKSMENMDYSRVIDDISPIPESGDESENHYAEICEYGLVLGNQSMLDRGPISLPNLSLFAEKDEVLSHISKNSSKDSGSVKKRILGKSKSSNESLSSRISVGNRDNSLDRDSVLTKEIVTKSRSSSSIGSTKINVVHRAHKVNQDNYITKEVKYDTMASSNSSGSKISIVSTESNLIQDSYVSKESLLDDAKEEEVLDKDKINEVYIIRVVVKDEEEDRMSTLTKSSSGGIYMKIRGFEVPKEELGDSVSGDELNGYDSLC